MASESNRLEGKVAIITGAASGIGETTARVFAAEGAQVILADIEEQLGEQVAASIGPSATYIHCDVTAEESVRVLMQSAMEKYGRVDIVHSDAGILGRQCSILDMDLHEFDRIMAVNVRGAVAAIKHGARAMIEAKIKGSIICTASTTAIVGGTSPHAYSVSKNALVGLVKSAASELGKHGIRVNCVSPYAVATRMLEEAWKEFDMDPANVEADCSALGNLRGAILKAKDVAMAVAFLASEDSAYISGHNLVVDGGFTVANHSLGIYR